MKIQPYRLSQIPMGDFTIVGYSVAGEESVILVPELDVCFDIGKCPREALTVNHVLLTHGHADHSVGLLYYFAQRDFQGIRDGVLIAPENMLDALEDLLHTWGRVDGKTPPYRLEGLSDGEDYEIRRNLLARAFKTKHVPGSLGYAVIDVRYKLREEFTGLSQQEIVEQKKKGVEITNRTEVPLVAYLGDTAKANYSDLPYVRDARALLIECTFFDDEHDSRALAGRHIHVDSLAEVLEGMNNEKIILTHVTRRTNLAQARKLLKQKLPADLLKRVTFLMSRKHIEDET
ncbi:MAG: MBL fold metallo-hydrolase [Phycisphaerae bacterium]|nr:MBL fold metallo-hydrolase [Phycisphaerae bacterium]